MSQEHKFVVLSQWSIDTDTTTVVATCQACGLRGLRSTKSVFLEGQPDDNLIETIGTRLVEAAETAALEHTAKVLANRPGATTTPQTKE